MNSLKIIVFLLLVGCKSTDVSKNKESYNVINTTIYEITQTKKGEEVYLFEESVPINAMLDDNFFSETYLKDTYGSGGVIGVDSHKVNKLLKDIDFNNVDVDKNKAQNWDTTQFTFPYKFLKENITNSIPKYKQHNLSMPLFVRDIYFFIYTDYYCGAECGQGTVVIFKKINGIWKEYERLPVWIS